MSLVRVEGHWSKVTGQGSLQKPFSTDPLALTLDLLPMRSGVKSHESGGVGQESVVKGQRSVVRVKSHWSVVKRALVKPFSIEPLSTNLTPYP